MIGKGRFLFLLILFIPQLLFGQKNEYNIYMGAGMTGLNYSLENGEQKMAPGGLLGVGYTRLFGRNWGVNTGLEVSLYRSMARLNDFTTIRMVTDIAGDPFEYQQSISNHRENQHAWNLNIPLMVKYSFGQAEEYYISGGGKIGIPIKNGSKVVKTSIYASGYYADENCLYEDIPEMGFGTFDFRNQKRSWSSKISYLLSLELGLRRPVNKRLFYYIAVYLDYGINNILKNEEREDFIPYNPIDPNNYSVQTVFKSSLMGTKMVDKVTLFTAGIKIGLILRPPRRMICHGYR